MSIFAKSMIAAIALAACAPAAFAGECPAGQTQPSKIDANAPSMPSKVTDTVIASIDLGAYGSAGKALRMRKLVVKPGGIVPLHAHNERPANIYVVSGQITEYRSTCAAPILHKAGDVTAESGNLSHWWKNNSRRTTVLISADILPPQMPAAASM
jgi:quercetin dioxygenase-like cupin family protein